MSKGTVQLGELGVDVRRTKKPKHTREIPYIPEEMDTQDSGEEAIKDKESILELPWSAKLFPNQQHKHDIYPQYYMGEDEEERYTGVEELFRCSDEMDERLPRFGPRVEKWRVHLLSSY